MYYSFNFLLCGSNSVGRVSANYLTNKKITKDVTVEPMFYKEWCQNIITPPNQPCYYVIFKRKIGVYCGKYKKSLDMDYSIPDIFPYKRLQECLKNYKR